MNRRSSSSLIRLMVPSVLGLLATGSLAAGSEYEPRHRRVINSQTVGRGVPTAPPHVGPVGTGAVDTYIQKFCASSKDFPEGRSADILVRSKLERADMRRKFQSCGADERSCGQECPRSGLFAALPPWTPRHTGPRRYPPNVALRYSKL